MTQITINSKTYQLSEKADVFNTHVADEDGKNSVPVSYTRDEIINGVRTGDKDILAFVKGRIEVGSPYFKEIIPTETDLENIKILEEAAAEVDKLKADLKESLEANKALEAEIKALKKAGTAKASDDKQGGV